MKTAIMPLLAGEAVPFGAYVEHLVLGALAQRRQTFIPAFERTVVQMLTSCLVAAAAGPCAEGAGQRPE